MRPTIRTTLLGGAAAVLLSGPALADGPHTFLDNLAGIDVSVEGGYLAGQGDLPYAQYYDGVKDYAFKVSPGNGWSGKFELNGRFQSGWNLSASYLHDSSSKSAATASYNGFNTPADYPVWNILGFQTSSGASGATSYNSATVSTKVHTDIIDLEAGHDVGLGIPGETMLLFGVRIADIEQRSAMDLFCSSPPGGASGPGGCATPSLEVSQNRGSRFSGFGPQLGLKYGAPVSDFGLGFFSSGLASVLVGKQEANTTSHWNSVTGPFPTLTSFHDHNAAYMLEARAGLNYMLPNCGTMFSLGYQVSWMSGVRDSRNGANATGTTDQFGSHNADLFYHGPFFRLTYSTQ